MNASVRLEFRGVTKRFASREKRGEPITAVRDVSFKISDGEVVALIGPSGCGKSTLLNMASGLDPLDEGVVLVDGEPVTKPNSHVAFMLQKDLLLPWRTILQNVELGQEIQGVDKAERIRRGSALLANYHLSEFAHHYPHQLSGGMRQRVALARTMAMNPAVLLLDEPFSALDAQTKMVLQKDLAQILSNEKKTALFITHDITEGIALSDRVLVMSSRPGTIVQEIVVDLPDRADPFKRRHEPRLFELAAMILDMLGLAHSELH